MNKFNFNKLTPFKWFVLENFPFIEADFDALTEWQLFCKLGKEINKIINSENTLGTQMENVTNAFIELQNYVNNYFDNLNVQDEINNKLNQMAQDGTLEEIIGAYLNTKAILGFDTINDMKTSENLIENSYAKTMGFNSLNDGCENQYKIIKEESAENVDGFTKINLGHDDLYAISIDNNIINVNKYGCIGDGVTDNTQRIKDIINKFPNHTIYFPDGKYLISDKISISNALDKIVNIKCSENAIFFSNVGIECFFEYGNTDRVNNFRLGLVRNFITGGYFDCANAKYGIIVDSRTVFPYIANINFIHVKNVGLYLRKDTSYSSGDCLVENINVTGYNSIAENNIETKGVLVESYDNELNNIRVQACVIGLQISGGGNKIYNAHPLLVATRTLSKEEMEKTIGFLIDCPGGLWNEFTCCYSDSMNTGFKVTNYSTVRIINSYMNTYVTPIEGLETQFLWLINSSAVASLINCRFDPTDPPSGVTNYKAYNIRVDSDQQSTIARNNIQCLNCRWNIKSYIPDNDLSYGLKTNNKRSEIYTTPYAHTMQSNQYYKVGLINISQALQKFEMNSASDGSWEIIINWQAGGSQGNAQFLKVTKLKGPTHNLSLAICDSFLVNGVRWGYLAVKTTDTDAGLNIGFENYSAGQNCELICAYEKFGLQPFTPTTIIAETSLN